MDADILTNRDPSDDASAMTDDRTITRGHSVVAFVLATLLALAGAWPACARIIPVGPHRAFKLPSQAALVARDGDTIAIDTGVYHDCAIWRAAHLTIEGRGPNVEIADTVCADRGLFVVEGANTKIRNLTFSGARGQGHNAAGILGLGDNLTVENARFVNNENGILLGGGATSRVRISSSLFQGNGSCQGACAHGVYAGAPIALLEVAYCRFLDTRIAHHIKSRALSTIVANNEIEDGDTGTSSYLIDIPNGGDVLIVHNTLQKGSKSSNPAVAITIGEEAGRNPTARLIVRDNRFASTLPELTIFVRNRTPTPVTLTGNVLRGKVVPLDGPGSVEP
jgi:hypothetical protein